MALAKCYNCGRVVDDNLPNCPGCNALTNRGQAEKAARKADKKAARQERIQTRSWTQTKGAVIIIAGCLVGAVAPIVGAFIGIFGFLVLLKGLLHPA